MDVETILAGGGLVVTGGALGKILDVAFRAWAARNQKGEVKVSPSPLLTQQQGPFVTVGECKQHRCALEKRIDALGPALNNAILKILARVDCGLKEKTLMSETELAMDRHDLTTDEFRDALLFLEDKTLVDRWTNLAGDVVWGVTAMGRDALKGL